MELRALGIANIIGSCFHCYTNTGSFSRSAVMDVVGAKTQLAGFVGGGPRLAQPWQLLTCMLEACEAAAARVARHLQQWVPASYHAAALQATLSLYSSDAG